MKEENNFWQVNWLSLILACVIALVGGLTSYFNALAQIREEIRVGIAAVRQETKENYASKEETKYIGQAIFEIKGDLKEIKSEILKRR